MTLFPTCECGCDPRNWITMPGSLGLVCGSCSCEVAWEWAVSIQEDLYNAEQAQALKQSSLQCAGCRRALTEGKNTSSPNRGRWCSSKCVCLGAVWCIKCWNKHIDRNLKV